MKKHSKDVFGMLVDKSEVEAEMILRGMSEKGEKCGIQALLVFSKRFHSKANCNMLQMILEVATSGKLNVNDIQGVITKWQNKGLALVNQIQRLLEQIVRD